jgi:hypothetical protein
MALLIGDPNHPFQPIARASKFMLSQRYPRSA